MSLRNLDYLFRPRSVAVIGASNRRGSMGRRIMRNLLAGGFRGPVYPVATASRSVAGIQAWHDVSALPQAPDLAVICTASGTLPQLVDALGARGTRAAILAAPVGQPSRETVVSAAGAHMLRLLGPDSMGLAAPHLGLDASAFPTPAQPGHLAFVSQSCALAAAALDWAATHGVGFSYVVSLGASADVDVADGLDYLGNHADTHGILLYVESITNARKFLSAARAASRNKPVIVLKAGRTPEGAQAVLRHTGLESGDDAVFDAAIRRAGMLRVHVIAELFAAAETLGRRRPHVGKRLIIVTNASGPGIVATDALTAHGGELATLSAGTVAGIAALVPAAPRAGNPLDLGGNASPARYAQTLKLLMNEPEASAILLMHGPSGAAESRAVAEACAVAVRDSQRHVMACWMGGGTMRRACETLRAAGIAAHATPESAVRAFLHLVQHERSLETLQQAPSSLPADFAPDRETAERLLREAAASQRTRLTDPEGKMLLAAYGIAGIATHVARDAGEAACVATQIGYPVALKVLSPQLAHRADVGSIMLNLESEDEVRRAAADLAGRMRQFRPDAALSGYTVQPMIRRPGAAQLHGFAHELVLEASEDRVFGPCMRLHPVGAGSAAAVGLVPLNAALACDLLERARLPAALAATLTRPAADLDALAAVLIRVSQLLVDHPQVTAVRVDPLVCDDRGATAVEVRVTLAPGTARGDRLAIPPYPQHLEESVEVRGERIALRPIKPEDGQRYAEFIAATESLDIRLRFFTLARHLPAKDLARYTQIDYDREMAFVAVGRDASGTDEILGEVRAFRYPETATAEFAILVRTDVKRRGVGAALLRKMIAYCKESGVEELIGQILRENQPMIALARRCGMAVDTQPGVGIAVAHLDLRTRV
jgi:acetyltransferase